MPADEDIFLNAVEISDEAERQRFVTEACGEDEVLLQRVLALLNADSEVSRIAIAPAMKGLQAGVRALREIGSSEQGDRTACA